MSAIYKIKSLGFVIALSGIFVSNHALTQPVNPPGSQTQVAPATVPPYQPPSYGPGSVNYVRIWEAQQPYTSESSLVSSGAVNAVHQTTQYLDGLGRISQQVLWQMSGTGNDLVSPKTYDGFDREAYQFLPYEAPTNTGAFQASPFSDQNTFYSTTYPSEQPAYTGEQIFFGQTQFEQSPLDRVLSKMAPGNSWAGNGIGTSIQYLTNTTTDQVPIWTITSNIANLDTQNFPSTTSNYAPETLYKTISTDEQGNQVIEYKDLEGQVVEKSVQVANTVSSSDPYTGWLVTMYVYDDLNQLRVVIPPKAVTALRGSDWQFSLAIIDGLCFRYEYDYRKRMLGKKVPGSGWEWKVYDQRDQLVFSQDANMGAENGWMTTIRDSLNRPIITGMTTYSGTQAQLEAAVTAATTNPGASTISTTTTGASGIPAILDVKTRMIGTTVYQAATEVDFEGGFESESGAIFSTQVTTGSPPTSTTIQTATANPIPSGATFIPLTELFYDNYSWGTTKTYNIGHNSQLDYGTNAYADVLPTSASMMTMGLPTGSRIRVLEDSADLTKGAWLETATFYDDKSRPIQTQADNYKAGGDTTTNRYDFSGKVVSSYLAHSNPQATAWIRVKTNMNYDGTGRLVNVKKELNDDPITSRTVSQFSYTRLGQLKTKLLGQKDYSNAAAMETQAYDYNIRGWLKGINRNFVSNSSGSGVWFGMDIAYDWGFSSNQLNGNIAGIAWKSGGNGEQRAYGYGYDRSNRLLFADFNQLFGSTWAKSDPSGTDPSLNIDFSSTMGDGQNYNTAYDDNGNILAMQQKGLVVNTSQLIDNLTYNYGTSGTTNQLQSVTDAVTNNKNLGDFYDGNTTGNDYMYDANGNLKYDLNKKINWVSYSYLNLPYQLALTPKAGITNTVTYIYDANGTKLEKRVHELPDSADNQQDTYTTTDYIGEMVYQNNVLQFIDQEEGRIRPKRTDSGQINIDTLIYDYFIRDHLGDTRMVLTEEQRTDTYPPASMELGDTSVENAFYANLDETRIPVSTVSGYPSDGATGAYVSAVGGVESPVHIGPSITLRVMAGDTLNMAATGWYGTSQSYQPVPVAEIAADLVSALAGGIQGVTTAEGSVLTTVPSSGLLSPDALNFLNSEPSSPSAPKAYLNWVFFDDQFRFVPNGSSADQVVASGSGLIELMSGAVIANKSGYVYIYLSNADSLTTVYFDNFQVVHMHGPLTEEEHYYPFGLTMQGISSRALQFGKYNRYRYNGKELQNREFSDGSGLELYDYGARFQDPQLGVWHQADPLADISRRWSPYNYAYDNPIRLIDPDGMEVTETAEETTYTGQDAVNFFNQLQARSNNDKKNGANGDDEDERNTQNLKNAKGYQQYHTIAERTNFYAWVDKKLKAKNSTVKWAQAAAQVASQVEYLTEWYVKAFGYSNEELANFAEEGNAKIFNDVFGKLATLLSGNPLTGDDAKHWDEMALSQEQTLVQGLYEGLSTKSLVLLSTLVKQNLVGTGTAASVPPFPNNGNLLNPAERWQYGMHNMGYDNASASEMLDPGIKY